MATLCSRARVEARWWTSPVALAAVLLAGCATGKIGNSGEGNPGGPGGGTETEVSAFGRSPGLRLLTRKQYVASVKALLDVDVDPQKVPAEQVREGHGQIASAQSVNYAAVDAFYDVSLVVAEAAVPKLGCAADDKACVAAKSDAFLRRAFRGGVDAETRGSYLAMLENPKAGDTARARHVTLIAAALSSPYFLYRQEIGTGAHAKTPNVRVLGQQEIATRLSYLVWGRGPDDVLLARADAGTLMDPAERLRELDRLLADPQAGGGLRGFVYDWMGLYAGGIRTKDPEVLVGTAPDLERSAMESFNLTVDSVLLTKERTFTALLSVDRYYVDGSLSKLLDIADTPATMEARALDTKKRAGILMHPVVLAGHTKESGVSPFSMGKFVYENVLCNVIGPPAVNVVAPEEGTDPRGKTLRQRLEETTAGPSCQTCHTKIGPSGFSFLPFDPIGRFSAEDRLGRPWDASGEVPVGDAKVSFNSAAELSQALAKQPGTAACVARRLFRWTYGHFEATADDAYLAVLEKSAIDNQSSVRALLAAMVGSEEFTLVRVGGK